MPDRHAFASAFAVWSTCEMVSTSAIYYAASSIFLQFQSDGDWALVGIAAMGVALLLLASVRGRSFDEAPFEALEQRPSSRRRSTGWFNAWCIVFPPVAMGMAQDQMNELAEGQA